MALSGGLPPAVIQARSRLKQGRVKLRALHDSGVSSLQVCGNLTDLLD